MHAVIVDVSIGDVETAQKELREQVVPRVSQAPGFVTGVWLSPAEGKGHSVVVFESEEAAKGMAGQVRSMPPSTVTIDNVQVREVVAHA
jgi:hypothetical protein